MITTRKDAWEVKEKSSVCSTMVSFKFTTL